MHNAVAVVFLANSWELNGEKVDFDDEIRMTENHSITIRGEGLETAKKYVGKYTCVASNGYSVARASAWVSLEGYTQRK